MNRSSAARVSYIVFDTAFRVAALMVSLLMLIFIMIAGAHLAMAATLRDDITLTGDNLTVGDIFDNAGRSADYVLGPAPQPGKEMVLNAPTLMRIALAIDLPWTPSSSAEQVVVRRAATMISADQVKEALIASLQEKGINDKFTLDTGASKLEITLPQSSPATVEVSNLTYNPRTNRFDATISAPSASNPVKQTTISGSVRPITSIPVLKSSIRNGDLIGSGDIDWIDLYTAEIQPDMLLKAEDLIGKTPRRMAIAGKPVHVLDLQSPQLVDRGETVTIVFEQGPLMLTASGKALQNGAKDDVIRVVNNSSNRPIDAIVSGTREVIVRQ
jgi:flagella basal body P-ring formation protein FlgA